jgi:hypothetical protein
VVGSHGLVVVVVVGSHGPRVIVGLRYLARYHHMTVITSCDKSSVITKQRILLVGSPSLISQTQL